MSNTSVYFEELEGCNCGNTSKGKKYYLCNWRINIFKIFRIFHIQRMQTVEYGNILTLKGFEREGKCLQEKINIFFS